MVGESAHPSDGHFAPLEHYITDLLSGGNLTVNDFVTVGEETIAKKQLVGDRATTKISQSTVQSVP